MTRTAVAAIVAGVYALLALLHVYWALGGGGTISDAVIPYRDGKPTMTPSRASTVAVALALSAACYLVLAQGALVPALLPAGWMRAGALGLGLVFLARAVGNFRTVGLFKRVRGTRFARWDDRLFSPLCVALGSSVLWLALG